MMNYKSLGTGEGNYLIKTHSKNIIFIQICNTYWRTCGIGNLTTRSEWPYVQILHFTRRGAALRRRSCRGRVAVVAALGAGAAHYVKAKSGGQRFSCAPHPACVSNHTPEHAPSLDIFR